MAGRNEALLASNTVSQEEYEQASAALKAAEADAAAGRASVKTARINRQYTVVTAPVAGRIGRSVVTEGAYVQQTSATLMATIQQIDSVYVDIAQSSADLLQLRRDLADHKLEQAGGDARVRLLLEDGSLYGEPGTLQFADVSVDPSTGSVTLRALFPNPRGELLPGMFVRARIEEGVQQNAILVPQRGVTRDAKGQAIAMVVTADKKVERRTLVAARAVDNAWLVSEGLVAGDQVIVDGLQKIRPGAEVVPVPAADANTDAGKPDANPTRTSPKRRSNPPQERACPGSSSIDRSSRGSSPSSSCWPAASSILSLPISQYPAIAPPAISISATYPGASAKTLEDTVTQVIEQKLSGLDGLRFMSSTSDSTGTASSPSPSSPAPTPTSPRSRSRTNCSSPCRSCRRRCSARASASPSRP
jgi:RND family efflux transporter MFP subunit